MNHLPNQDAVAWYIARIHQIVRTHIPNCTIHIVGSPTASIPQWIRDNPELFGVNILGYVTDVKPLFNSVLATVAPLRFGAGVKGKIGQSLAYGVPVVTTVVGAEGMHLTESDVGIARNEDEFADIITALHLNKTFWESLRKGGQRIIRNNFSRTVAMLGIKKILKMAEHSVSCRLTRAMTKNIPAVEASAARMTSSFNTTYQQNNVYSTSHETISRGGRLTALEQIRERRMRRHTHIHLRKEAQHKRRAMMALGENQ